MEGLVVWEFHLDRQVFRVPQVPLVLLVPPVPPVHQVCQVFQDHPGSLDPQALQVFLGRREYQENLGHQVSLGRQAH